MKQIKQLQAVLLNKDDETFSGDFEGVKNAWWIFYEGEKDTRRNDDGFTMKWNLNTVAIVYQYETEYMKCEISDWTFQNEYTKDELEQIIIQDIREEYGDLFLPDYLVSDINVFSIMWSKLSTEMRSLITNIIGIRYGKKAEEKLRLCTYISERDIISDFIKFERIISEQIKLIKELDEAITNLKKETGNGEKDES